MNLFDRVSPEIRNILDSALDGHEVSWQDHCAFATPTDSISRL